MASGAEIGVIGGSGFYELLTDAEEHAIETPYGAPSDRVMVGRMAGRDVAFLPRHSREHTIPPHRINYRANLWVLRELGVTRLLAPCAVGALQPDLELGTFVVLDQFVDRTRSRADTYFDEAPVTHVSMADPYCPVLRGLATDELTAMGRPSRAAGTIVVIQGPRFSTRAESRWFRAAGGDVIGMTQYPEVPLARELALCVAGVAMVTDHDAGLEDDPGVEPVSNAAVQQVFRDNATHVRTLVERVIAQIPADRSGCTCSEALVGAQF